MIKVNDYVIIKNIIDEFPDELIHMKDSVFKVVEIIDCDYMEPYKYGINVSDKGIHYFSDEEVEEIKPGVVILRSISQDKCEGVYNNKKFTMLIEDDGYAFELINGELNTEEWEYVTLHYFYDNYIMTDFIE